MKAKAHILGHGGLLAGMGNWFFQWLERLGSGASARIVVADEEIPPQYFGVPVLDAPASALPQERPSSLQVFGDVPIDYSLPWDQAIRLGAPNTADQVCTRIWQIGDLYPRKRGTAKVHMTILNFGRVVEPKQVLEFGEKEDLGSPFGPRECWALGAHQPFLAGNLDRREIQLISLEAREFEDEKWWPCLRWSGDYRSAYALPVGANLGANFWFGFFKPA